MGLIYINGGYYYINSSKVAVRGCTYATTSNNGLLPNGTYTFGEDGRIIDPPTDATVENAIYASKSKASASSIAVTAETTSVTTRYHYVGDTLAGMTCGNDELYFVYDVLGPSAVIYNGTTYYYVRNAQGDITHIYNSSGTKVVSYTYDAWGNAISITGSMMTTLGALNPLRYRGYVYDSETGLYYLQSRYNHIAPSGAFLFCRSFLPRRFISMKTA